MNHWLSKILARRLLKKKRHSAVQNVEITGRNQITVHGTGMISHVKRQVLKRSCTIKYFLARKIEKSDARYTELYSKLTFYISISLYRIYLSIFLYTLTSEEDVRWCSGIPSLNLNLNSLLMKRQVDNPSPGAVTEGN